MRPKKSYSTFIIIDFTEIHPICFRFMQRMECKYT
nr:MAG TPA: hypothetical protein [Caudoviricetes sp.]